MQNFLALLIFVERIVYLLLYTLRYCTYTEEGPQKKSI